MKDNISSITINMIGGERVKTDKLINNTNVSKLVSNTE